jgi:hypothetical protein
MIVSKYISKIKYFLNRRNTYYNNCDKKSYISMVYGQIFWLLRYGEFNHNYYLYGLDRKSSSIREYLPGKKLDYVRRVTSNKKYVCILSDKFVFGQFFRSMGYPTPKNRAVIEGEQVKWVKSREVRPLESILKKEADYICKPIGKGGR